MSIFQYYSLERAEFFIFDEFLICQIREGVEIQPEQNKRLNDIIQKHFEGKNVAYISNRVHSYSVNPLTYLEIKKIPNLVAIAIVIKNEVTRANANYEKSFYNKPYEVFTTLSEAIIWVQEILNSAKKEI